MSKWQRDRLVELLRCAADSFEAHPKSAPIGLASWQLRASTAIVRRAFRAEEAVLGNGSGDRTRRLLEAAQRVEEGTWP